MQESHEGDPDLDVVESIYDALDREDPALALRLANRALEEFEEDPVIHFLAGIALLELDEPEGSVDSLSRAVQLDPDDAEFRANLALALYHCCRFEEGLAEARLARERDGALPDAHYVLALLVERGGDWEAADEAFSRAAALDPDRFEVPHRMDAAEFERHLERARAKLDESIADQLDEVAVTVEALPSDEILRDEDPFLDPELFGLFVGVPRTARSTFSPGGDLPPRILLFRRNLERCFPDAEELERQIAITLYHELGHYLGMDEEQLAKVDFD